MANKGRIFTHKFIKGRELKRCSHCKVYLSLDKYCNSTINPDKLGYECKHCLVERNSAHNKKWECDFIDDEIISMEELKIKLAHEKELDYIEKYGYDRWYWDSLEEDSNDYSRE